MGTFETVLLILLVVDALALIGLVLIQQSKGADVGAAFGSGSAGTMFGSSGGTSFLVKVTTILAILFFVIAFALAYTAKERADRLSGFEFTEETSVTEVEQNIPDVGVDSTVDETTVLEGDELPILTAPEPSVDETTADEGSADLVEEDAPQQ